LEAVVSAEQLVGAMEQVGPVLMVAMERAAASQSIPRLLQPQVVGQELVEVFGHFPRQRQQHAQTIDPSCMTD
jgi:hypothetical protein